MSRGHREWWDTIDDTSEEAPVFSHHCTACDRTQLIFSSQVTTLTNDELGIAVSFRCWCGSEQTKLTGKGARVARALVAA